MKPFYYKPSMIKNKQKDKQITATPQQCLKDQFKKTPLNKSLGY